MTLSLRSSAVNGRCSTNCRRRKRGSKAEAITAVDDRSLRCILNFVVSSRQSWLRKLTILPKQLPSSSLLYMSIKLPTTGKTRETVTYFWPRILSWLPSMAWVSRLAGRSVATGCPSVRISRTRPLPYAAQAHIPVQALFFSLFFRGPSDQHTSPSARSRVLLLISLKLVLLKNLVTNLQ